jgi:hypothetical protein
MKKPCLFLERTRFTENLGNLYFPFMGVRDKGRKPGYFPKFVIGFGERGKARSKRSGRTEEGMMRAMSDEEDRSGEAAADQIPDEFVKVAGNTPNQGVDMAAIPPNGQRPGPQARQANYGGAPVPTVQMPRSNVRLPVLTPGTQATVNMTAAVANVTLVTPNGNVVPGHRKT